MPSQSVGCQAIAFKMPDDVRSGAAVVESRALDPTTIVLFEFQYILACYHAISPCLKC